MIASGIEADPGGRGWDWAPRLLFLLLLSLLGLCLWVLAPWIGSSRLRAEELRAEELPAGELQAKPPPAPGAAEDGAAWLHGRVLDELGQALAGVQVQVQVHAGPSIGQPSDLELTDSQGRFRLQVRAGIEQLVWLQHRDFPVRILDYELLLGEGESRAFGDLFLVESPGLVVETVAARSRRRVGGAHLELKPVLEDARLPEAVPGLGSYACSTSALGLGTFYGLPPGGYILRVEAPGFATQEIRHLQPRAATGPPRLSLALLAEEILRGRVLDARGQPVPDAVLLCGGGGGGGGAGGGGPLVQGRSDAQGTFALRGLGPGKQRLLLASPADGILRLDLVLPQPDLLVLRLPPPRTVSGQVLEAGSHLPLAAARVSWEARIGWPAWLEGRLEAPSTGTDAQGNFRLRGLPAGRIWIRARSEGHIPARAGPLEADESRITLRLEAGIRVTGKVLDPNGRPLSGVSVQAIPLGEDGLGDMLQLLQKRGEGKAKGKAKGMKQEHSGHSGRSGRGGRFELAGLLPGRYRLLLQSSDLPACMSPVFGGETPPRRRLDLGSLRLPLGSQISGLVTGPAGEFAAGATVYLDPLGSDPCQGAGAKARTDARGRYHLPCVAPGLYAMSYDYPDAQGPRAAAATRAACLIKVRVTDRQDLRIDLKWKDR